MSEPNIQADAAAQLRHDFRTPINHIIGYSEILLEECEGTGNGSSASDLKKIRVAAEQLLALINTRLSPGGIASAPSNLSSLPPRGEESKRGARTFRGRVLAVDDSRENLDVLAHRLARHGLDVETADSGREAWDTINSSAFDLVLLDVMMPGVDGYTLLTQIKSDPQLRDIPVIMISAWDELDSVVRCIEAGAEDYLHKPFNPTLLEARIGACLDKKALHDAGQRHLRKIEETQKRLDKELAEAAAYVRSILPPPTNSPLRVDWKYRPSSELAGDSFGYHAIDSDHFAIYLLDVCGHGVGACLLSVSAINVLRSGSLPGVDFRKPGEVLTALNNAFPMEHQNNLYFTLWYGVYNAPSRMLSYASGGHPPALLLEPEIAGKFKSRRLTSNGMIIGVMDNMHFAENTCEISAEARLIVLCDGCYEIRNASGEMRDYETLQAFLQANASASDLLERVETWAVQEHGDKTLEDDFSIIEVQFPK
jgi:sigma-B regulation protein RsbU (phosphoserine phosphatase)